jgi:hypothetical protein
MDMCVGVNCFGSAGFIKPDGSSSFMQSSFEVFEIEDFFCLFGTCKLQVRVTVHH